MTAQVLIGDVREQLAAMPESSVQCVITSPPYWNLRDYGEDGQIGLEPTVGEYVKTMVDVFALVHRVLRHDGTLWLNLGDTYAGSWGAQYRGATDFTSTLTGGDTLAARKIRAAPRLGTRTGSRGIGNGVKAKDLIGVPWRVAFALQEWGWWLRQEIIWHKPSPMPESVKDRFCRSHEHVFLLTKSDRYYFDWLGGSEEAVSGSRGSSFIKGKTGVTNRRSSDKPRTDASRRTGRTVWRISSQGFKGAHFATFPPALVERCLLPGTSPAGACAECGAPLKRIVTTSRRPTRPGTNSKVNRASDDPGALYEQHSGAVVGNRDPQRHVTDYETAGWERTCRCETTETRPCVVLDPFVGSGTTLFVANELGRDAIGIELNPEYAQMAIERAGQAQRRIVELAGVA